MIRGPECRGEPMARFYTETDVIAEVQDLTSARLGVFLRGHLIAPLTTPTGPAFDEADVARLQLLCDLAECYELPDDSLVLVMSLIDQLNTARGDIRALMRAVADEPDEVRGRIRETVHRVRIVSLSRD